ncbi:MAG TPA: VWA domain-containing protein [Pyrinomonadaceae bacterium]|jgi:VWFA-related protein|nr:VWA domain-containing protein [Pyrinomonadaceae bacterium]
MNAKPFVSLVLSLCVFSPVLSQKPADDDVVRITTNLVQIDAIVTKDGKNVPNLKPEDFEIFEDGRKQTITSFAYISNVPATATAPTTEGDKSVPVTPLKPGDPRRTIAIVVDDLGLSAESISDVRRQLRKFVNERIQPYDLVAIIRTGSQIGALQQFTNDKRLLLRAVDQLRWNACSRVGVNVLPPSQQIMELGTTENVCGGFSFFSTMRALRTIIDGMAEIPGRKSMMILSDSLPTESQDSGFFNLDPQSPLNDRTNRVIALQRVAEKAIRASVVIYAVDTQGLQTTGITAADRFTGNARTVGAQMNAMVAARSRVLFDRRAGGELMARQTGGFQVKNSNDFKLERILEEQNGYYLIGYRPTDETFNKKFHRITAKVKRSGMSLRTRYGFFGYSEEDDVRKPQSKTNLALSSPFGAQDIDLEFTAFFANDKVAGSVIRSFLYLDAKDLTFVQANGKYESHLELHGVIFGDNGTVADQIRHEAVMSLPEADYQRAVREGIRIRFDMPARKPGAYQLRVAARDTASSRIGSAGQFVGVPNLKNKRLAVSGIVLRGVTDVAETDTSGVASVSPAFRHFVANSEMQFALVIYNAGIDPAAGRPNLVMETKLFRNDKRVQSYSAVPVDMTNQPDLQRIFATRIVQLGANLEPGHYYLLVEITDKTTRDKEPPIAQWIDFEIVK